MQQEVRLGSDRSAGEELSVQKAIDWPWISKAMLRLHEDYPNWRFIFDEQAQVTGKPCLDAVWQARHHGSGDNYAFATLTELHDNIPYLDDHYASFAEPLTPNPSRKRWLPWRRH